MQLALCEAKDASGHTRRLVDLATFEPLTLTELGIDEVAVVHPNPASSCRPSVVVPVADSDEP